MSYVVYKLKEAINGTDRIGGKGSNLAKAKSYISYKIPAWRGITAQACYDAMTVSQWAEMKDRIMSYDLSTIQGVHDAAVDAQYFFCTHAKVPTGLIEELEEMHNELSLFAEGITYAVRSSAIEEDGAVSSFAGQHDSLLGVSKDDIPSALVSIWASLYNERAMAYRIERGLSVITSQMGVVVQRMVKAAYAGVGFSIDPTGSFSSATIIEVVHGLGESLVGGKVNPTTYIVNREDNEVIHEEVKEQGTGVVVMADGSLGEKAFTLSPKLSQIALSSINKLVLALEGIMGCPVDVEWAIDEHGVVYLLQVRPLTGIMSGDGKMTNLSGNGASPGIAVSVGTFIDSPHSIIKSGNPIMLTKQTTPEFLPLIRKVAGIITATGGVTCHAAIISRELGIPCIVGVGMPRIQGLIDKNIRMNGGEGTIEVLD